MEPNEHNSPERNTPNPPNKDTTEIALDDTPSEESKGSSNEGIKEPQTNQTTFSLNNSNKQSKKPTLLDSANTKDKNAQKPNESRNGFGFDEKLKRSFADKLNNAKQFFEDGNPYSSNPKTQDEVRRCQELYPDPSVLQSASNYFGVSPFASVSLIAYATGQKALLTAGVRSAFTGQAMLEVAMATNLVGFAVTTAITAGPIVKGIYDQHKHDIENVNSDRIRCETDFLKRLNK